jgi:threonyl-tRNA synthetase
MIKITLSDGSIKEFKAGISVLDIAKSISEGLARLAIAAKIDGKLSDLTTTITKNSNLEIITPKSEESLDVLRHTTGHVFAQAILRLHPEAKITIGPAIEHGFYYDVDCEKLNDEELPKIEDEMQKIIKEKLEISINYKTKEEALKFFYDNHYKQEIIEAISQGKAHEDEKGEADLEDGKFKFYKQGEFEDICTGPHLTNTGLIKAFKLEKVTKAYWRADANNKQLNRVYGSAFWKKSEMDEYYTMIEEAKKRDHRIIGKKMDLYSISDFAPGMPFFHNRGMVLWNELMNYWETIHKKDSYEIIKTPIMLNKSLWETSGHWEHYRENMYETNIDNVEYAIKPMNCPGGILVYKTKSHSYKDLPLKSGEVGLVHRHELSGALTGLFRVRCFHQDDAHIFMREDQITEQILGVLNLVEKTYSMLGLDYHLELSTRPEEGSIGTDENWEKAETGLKIALEEFKKGYKMNPGDGAFYGPKIDIHLKDAIGRTHQCGTIQLDMNLPERFDMNYINEKDEKVRPIMIHRVIYGSFERFLGILIENFAGKFPLWLAPVQVKIINVADRHQDYCDEIKTQLEEEDFRVETDYSNEGVGKKIAMAREFDKPNYMLILGDKDIENKTVSVRTRKFVDGKNEEFTTTIKEF